MFNLTQLEHLLALDDARHFAKAADKVHLTQPAFSRSIQALERQAGLMLFERKGRHIAPTPAGSFFIERARLVLMQAKSLKRDIKLYQDGEIGSLAFGVGPFPSATLAGPVTQLIRQKHPKATVKVEVVNQQALMALLIKEEIEFYVADAHGIPRAPYLSINTLMRQHAHLYARKGHPLAGKTIRFEQAWHYGMATVKLPDAVKLALAQLMAVDPHQMPEAAFECDDVNLLCSMAQHTDSVVALTDVAHQSSGARDQLVQLDVSDFPNLFADISVVTLAGRTLSPLAEFAIHAFGSMQN